VRVLPSSDARKNWLRRAWTASKSWRRIRLGPVSLLYRLARSQPLRPLSRHSDAPRKIASREAAQPDGLGCVFIAGCGPRFGRGAAHYFAHKANRLVLAARDGPRLQEIAREIKSPRALITPLVCDLTDEGHVRRAFRELVASAGPPELVIYSVEGFYPGSVIGTTVAAFEESWRSNCLGAFILAREAARAFLKAGRGGTLVLLGGTSSVMAREGYLNLSVGKFGLRALAHVLSRELSASGIHVVHCLIDAEIAHGQTSELTLNAEHLAAEILRLHSQPADCWTSELDLRPAKEAYWQHC
jgi:NAD(P)-dependent dehydrogenase (short-subunit alcohol dehydrogenase family)